MHRKAQGTRETPSVGLEIKNQPATRESQAGLIGVAVRFVVRAEQRIVQEGSSPSGARMRGAVFKSGSNASLAGEERRYGEA
jgi:hypothetical protein